MKSRSSRFTRTGSRACGRCPEPSSATNSPPVSFAIRSPVDTIRTASSVPWITSTGHVIRLHRRANSSGSFELAAQVRERERLARRLEAPADAVLDLLRRVRLGEGLREEELEEVAVVLEPVVAVVLRPALVRLQRLVERRLHARPVHAERRGRRDEHGAVDALGVLGGEQGAPEGAGRQPDDHGAVGAGGVHHRDGVRDELASRRRPRPYPGGPCGRSRGRRRSRRERAARGRGSAPSSGASG